MLSLFLLVLLPAFADEPSPAERRLAALEFHLRAQERPGVLIPLYVYPTRAEATPAYARLIDAKRRFETVPFWVIINPASGPGKKVDPTYTRVIDRLRGAGCVLLAYVSTSYGKRPAADVQADIDTYRKFYPRLQGIFFDEMIYEDTDAAVKIQVAYRKSAHEAGYWPTVANPGAATPGRYFSARAADVIVIHEGNAWPREATLKGETPGGYADHPPFTRGLLLHSRDTLDRAELKTARRYVRWIYVTEGLFRPGDATAANPWDRLSKHLESLCEQLER